MAATALLSLRTPDAEQWLVTCRTSSLCSVAACRIALCTHLEQPQDPHTSFGSLVRGPGGTSAGKDMRPLSLSLSPCMERLWPALWLGCTLQPARPALRSDAAASGDATRAALNTALGRWAEAGGVGSSRDVADEDGAAAAPSWTTGMWQDGRRGPNCCHASPVLTLGNAGVLLGIICLGDLNASHSPCSGVARWQPRACCRTAHGMLQQYLLQSVFYDSAPTLLTALTQAWRAGSGAAAAAAGAGGGARRAALRGAGTVVPELRPRVPGEQPHGASSCNVVAGDHMPGLDITGLHTATSLASNCTQYCMSAPGDASTWMANAEPLEPGTEASPPTYDGIQWTCPTAQRSISATLCVLINLSKFRMRAGCRPASLLC